MKDSRGDLEIFQGRWTVLHNRTYFIASQHNHIFSLKASFLPNRLNLFALKSICPHSPNIFSHYTRPQPDLKGQMQVSSVQQAVTVRVALPQIVDKGRHRKRNHSVFRNLQLQQFTILFHLIPINSRYAYISAPLFLG
jgi:hypothetical protein